MVTIAAGIFDHPAVLLLIALVALVRWLITKASAPKQTTDTPPPPPPSQPISRGGETRTEEERIRKFLEALGQRPGTQPPKVTPRPRSVAPKIFPRLPALKTVPPPLPRQPSTPVLPSSALPIEAAPASGASLSDANYRVQSVVRQTSSEPSDSRQPLTALGRARIKFGTPQDLRNAIVLREIFGPPRSLQSGDLTSSL